VLTFFIKLGKSLWSVGSPPEIVIASMYLALFSRKFITLYELDGYYDYWNYAEKKGYSGTAVFTKIKPKRTDISQIFDYRNTFEVDFSEVKGQEHVKRSLEVAAAGGHNLIIL